MFACSYCERKYRHKGCLDNHFHVCLQKKKAEEKRQKEDKDRLVLIKFDQLMNELNNRNWEDANVVVRELCLRIAKLQHELEITHQKLSEQEELSY